MNEKNLKPKKLYKITTHNTMIETYEVEADSLDSARSYVFDCWTAEDDYPLNVERTEQYFDGKSVGFAQSLTVCYRKADPNNRDILLKSFNKIFIKYANFNG